MCISLTFSVLNEDKFIFDNDAPEILLNNLASFNERAEDIVNLTSGIEEYGTEEQKYYLPYLQQAGDFWNQNQRFPTLAELNECFNEGEPISERTEDCADAAYAEIANILDEEEKVAEYRSVLRSKDAGRVADFAKRLQPSAPLPEVNTDKILDIKSIRRNGRTNQKSPIISGIRVYDNEVHGFRNKTINTISAPSSGGKTTFAVNMAYNNAVKGKLVVYCALESSAEEIQALLLSLAYKYTKNEDDTFLADEFKQYSKMQAITEIQPGTVNSFRFYQLSQELDDSLVDNYQNRITENGGNIYVIDDSCCNLRSIRLLTETIEAIAEKEGRKVDLVVIDNADDLTSFKAEGKSESDMTMVNRMINELNAYSTTHYDGTGTTILFLAQLNRTGITESSKENPGINMTHISTYSNLNIESEEVDYIIVIPENIVSIIFYYAATTLITF